MMRLPAVAYLRTRSKITVKKGLATIRRLMSADTTGKAMRNKFRKNESGSSTEPRPVPASSGSQGADGWTDELLTKLFVEAAEPHAYQTLAEPTSRDCSDRGERRGGDTVPPSATGQEQRNVPALDSRP